MHKVYLGVCTRGYFISSKHTFHEIRATYGVGRHSTRSTGKGYPRPQLQTGRDGSLRFFCILYKCCIITIIVSYRVSGT